MSKPEHKIPEPDSEYRNIRMGFILLYESERVSEHQPLRYMIIICILLEQKKVKPMTTKFSIFPQHLSVEDEEILTINGGFGGGLELDVIGKFGEDKDTSNCGGVHGVDYLTVTGVPPSGMKDTRSSIVEMRGRNVSCDPIIRYTLSKKSYKSRKVNEMNKMAISASTFIEIETNEI
ncbi:hypothetical protein YC2023_052566 [Brassica napus]